MTHHNQLHADVAYVVSQIQQLIGMPYVFVSKELVSNVSNAPPFWNKHAESLPPLAEVRSRGSCCAGLANIARRILKKKVPPHPGTPNGSVGGTDAWFAFLHNLGALQRIDFQHEYPKGTLLLQDYNATDQGHVAIVTSVGRPLLDSRILHAVGGVQSTANCKCVEETVSQYAAHQRFTHIASPQDWLFA